MQIVDLLFPPSCAFCGTDSRGNEKNICAGCYADLPWRNSPCLPVAAGLTTATAMLDYSFPVDAAIKALKFGRKLHYGPALAETLFAGLHLLPDDIDAVLPVPLHWRRKTWRGFNQANEIAAPVARRMNLPLIRNVARRKPTPYQSGLDAHDRASNLAGAFHVRGLVTHRHVLIVDDVFTTGATAEKLGSVVLQAGAGAVSMLAVARAT